MPYSRSSLNQGYTASDYESTDGSPVYGEIVSPETRVAHQAAATWNPSSAPGSRTAPIDLTGPDEDTTVFTSDRMRRIQDDMLNRAVADMRDERFSAQYPPTFDHPSTSNQAESTVDLIPRFSPVKRNMQSALGEWDDSDCDLFSTFKKPQHSYGPASFHQFLDLPTELRTLVLEQYSGMHGNSAQSSPIKILKLRPVCKQLASEAVDLYIRMARLPENKRYTELKLHPQNMKRHALDGMLLKDCSGLHSVIKIVVVDIAAILQHDSKFIPKVTNLLHHLPNLTVLTIDHVMGKDADHRVATPDSSAGTAGLNPIHTALDLAIGTKISHITIYAPHTAFELGNYLSRYNMPQLNTLTSLTITLTCPAPNGLLQDNTPHFSCKSASPLAALLRQLPNLEHLSLLRNCSRTINGRATVSITHILHPCFDDDNADWLRSVIGEQTFSCLKSLTVEGFLLKEAANWFERWNLRGVLRELNLKHCAVGSKKDAGPWVRRLRAELEWERLKGLGWVWSVREGYWTKELLWDDERGCRVRDDEWNSRRPDLDFARNL